MPASTSITSAAASAKLSSLIRKCATPPSAGSSSSRKFIADIANMAPTIATTAPAIIPIASKVRFTKPRLSVDPQRC
jgi:hypothetical protein